MSAETDYAEAQRRIAEVRKNGETKLDLSRLKQLDRFPPEITELKDLTDLSAWNTQISDLSPLQWLAGLQTLNLLGAPVTDVSPLQGLAGLKILNLTGTQVSDLSPLNRLASLQRLNLTRTKITDLSPLQGLTDLKYVYLIGTQISDLTPLQGLALSALNLNRTRITDLRPLVNLRPAKQGGPSFPRLYYKDTPALNDPFLAQLFDLTHPDERAQKTLAYLRSLPEPPAPLPWQVTDNPTEAAGTTTSPPEHPGPKLAPIMVEFRDGHLHTVSPGTGLPAAAEDRAKQGWAALRAYLADLVDLRSRLHNMPNLLRAILSLERALGTEFDRMNPVDVGMQGERVIRLSRDCDDYLMDQDPEEVRAMAAQVALYLRRFQTWEDFRSDPAPADATPDNVQAAADDLKSLAEAVAAEDWIGEDVKAPLAEAVDHIIQNPTNETDIKGTLLSISNILDKISEAGIRHRVELPGSTRGGLIVAGGGAAAAGAIAFLSTHPILLQRLGYHFHDTLWFLNGVLKFVVPGL